MHEANSDDRKALWNACRALPIVAFAFVAMIACSSKTPDDVSTADATQSETPAESASTEKNASSPTFPPKATEDDSPSADDLVLEEDVLADKVLRDGRSKSHADSHARMLTRLKEIADTASDNNSYFEDATLRQDLQRLSESGRVLNDATWALKYRVGQSQFRLGQEAAAIKSYEQCLGNIDRVQAGKKKANRLRLVFQLGVAYLRLAETTNCCNRYTKDSCVFPIQGNGVHVEKEPSRRAIKYFTEVLRNSNGDSKVHLSSLWLLNIAHMTIGSYPDGVPEEFLIPAETLKVNDAFPRFENVSKDVGLGTLSLAGGAIADDFDNDGRIDVLASTWHPAGNIQLFKNQGDGGFVDVTAEAGLKGVLGGLNMVQADYDNDGHVDILVLRGGWLGQGGMHPNSLLRNLGNGKFEDVAYFAGIAGSDFPSMAAGWADFDNDGWLDLFVGNESSDDQRAPCQLFRNNGDGTFTNVARKAGVTNERFAKAATWGDYNNDNWPDLYVSNFGSPNRLYRNNGDGTFEDVAPQLGIEKPIESFPTWFWDVDNDGDLDLFVGAYGTDVSDVARSYLGRPNKAELPKLYINDGQGGFDDRSKEFGLSQPTAPMAANFGDLDNDGFLDFYLGTGYPNYYALMPNVMYWNRGGKQFEDVTFAGGFGNLQKGHGIAFADFDGDGDQDIFEQMGGWYIGDPFVDALYQNPGFGNRWVALELVGGKSNRSAIGARIQLRFEDGEQSRVVYRRVCSGGSFGANPFRQSIGVGKAKSINELRIYWPATGKQQSFKNVTTNQRYRLAEDGSDLEVVKAQP